jgi:hypothetical protein
MKKTIFLFLILAIASCGKEEDVNNHYEELYKIRQHLDASYLVLNWFSDEI